jgi:alpha-D-ribose 1-methylphosphonate 5-triphosphate synthase subunit PhnH
MSVVEAKRDHRLFRAALLALAYPGRRLVAEPARNESWSSMQLALRLVGAIWNEAADRQSAADAEEADVLLVAGETSDGLVLRARRGSEEYPERGATIIYAVSGETETRVRLHGPGVDGVLETTLPLTPQELRDRACACAASPLGIDLLVALPDGSVLGVPRTTAVEVLA